MEDSTLPTRDMFPMNKIFVNYVVGSSKTVPTEVVEDEDVFHMDSSEAFAGNEEGDDDLNRVGDESGTKAVYLLSCVDLDEPSSIIVGMSSLALASFMVSSVFIPLRLRAPANSYNFGFLCM
ncbi:hypothetical protein L6452_32382 [Arctium lappa]|uniref:Uncharacterized protein n=1 Tax=Arctium lappa TaxID=4217 RepID=A0ACB8Z5J9_ARCLA|nr:hypothetical protein L6452_32382 [Arctium lappa]